MSGLHVRASVAETGESPFSVRIDVGGHVLTGDEPVETGGGGLGPAPYQLLTAALAECTAMTVRWYARQHGWPVEHVAVTVDYNREKITGASGTGDVFTKTVAIRGPELTLEQRERLLDVAAKCPVHRTLEGRVDITTLAAEPA